MYTFPWGTGDQMRQHSRRLLQQKDWNFRHVMGHEEPFSSNLSSNRKCNRRRGGRHHVAYCTAWDRAIIYHHQHHFQWIHSQSNSSFKCCAMHRMRWWWCSRLNRLHIISLSSSTSCKLMLVIMLKTDIMFISKGSLHNQKMMEHSFTSLLLHS